MCLKRFVRDKKYDIEHKRLVNNGGSGRKKSSFNRGEKTIRRDVCDSKVEEESILSMGRYSEEKVFH